MSICGLISSSVRVDYMGCCQHPVNISMHTSIPPLEIDLLQNMVMCSILNLANVYIETKHGLLVLDTKTRVGCKNIW